MIKICKCCEIEFETKNIRKMFCSTYCQSKNWYNVNTIEKVCIVCKKVFQSPKDKIKCCSRECADVFRTKGKIKIKCLQCGIEFEDYESFNRKFCSTDCSNEFNSGENNSSWAGGNIKIICQNCGKTKEKTRQNYYNNKNHFCGSKCFYEFMVGDKHWGWNGGSTEIRDVIRTHRYYLKSRKECFKRDNYKSVLSEIRGELHCHHIKSLSDVIKENEITIENWERFSDILFDVNNLATLLKTEHQNFHSLYGKSNIQEKFEEFKNNYLTCQI